MFNTFDPLVSIMMLTYNQEEYVEASILSVLSQDYENFELIVSDDYSTDRTRDIIEKLYLEFPNKIKILFNERNLGITGNSNCALEKCEGDLIAFAYGDDLMLPSKISAQVEWFTLNPDGVLCGHDVEVFDSANNAVIYRTSCRSTQGVGAHRVIKDGGLYQTTSIMVKRSAVPPEGFDQRVPHCSDFLFIVRLLAVSGGVFGKVEGILARYRRHKSNASALREVCISDIEKSLNIIAKKHPDYSSECEQAVFQHVHYLKAVYSLADGNYVQALRLFFRLLLKHPLQLKVYFRILQIPFVVVAILLCPKVRLMLFQHERIGL